jgi:hypothetical protein
LQASSAATTDEIKAALVELRKDVTDSPKFGTEEQQAIQDALEKLQTQFDASPKFDPETVRNLGDAVAQLAKLVDSALDTNPARLALRRLLPNHHRQITVVNTGKTKDAKDSFRVYGKQGAITIEGTSPAVILTGLKRYLEQVAMSASAGRVIASIC